jgi:hypothetical protein
MLDFPSWLGHKTVYSLVVTVSTVSSPMHYYMPLAVSRALAMVLGSKFTYYDDMVLVFFLRSNAAAILNQHGIHYNLI